MSEIVTLAPQKFNEILQLNTVDSGTGSLFGVLQKRDASTDHLTLIISTGGSGKSSIVKAINTASERLKVDFRQYVKFLVLDSATSELEPLTKKGIDVFNISYPGIQSRLAPPVRTAFFKKMIPTSFPIHVIDGEGAGQIRLIGRTKLYDEYAGSANDIKLRDKIASYFKNEWNFASASTHIDIIILTGVSGGNGSGTFIDIAAIAREACPCPSTVYGYIMLPDTVEHFATNTANKNVFYKNGYAALKELESYESLDMDLPANGYGAHPNGRIEEIRTHADAPIEFSNTKRPFNYPVLVSGNYDDAVDMIAETIVNSISSIDDPSNAGVNTDQAFSQASFYSNNQTKRRARQTEGIDDLGILREGKHPEDSHMYCAIGYAHASIPEKVVIPHVLGSVSRKLYVPQTIQIEGVSTKLTPFCTKNAGLTRLEFNTAMGSLLYLNNSQLLKADSFKASVFNKFMNTCKLPPNPVEPTYDELVDGQTRAYYAGFKTEQTVNKSVTEMSAFAKQTLEDFKERAKKLMIQYGPRVMHYLYEGTGNVDESGTPADYSEFGLKAQIAKVTDMFLEISRQSGRKPRPLETKGFFSKAFTAKNAVLDWCQEATNAQTIDMRAIVAQNMRGADGIWETEFVTPLKEYLSYVKRFAEVLEAVSDFYTGEGKSLDNTDYLEFSRKSIANNGINLCTDADMYDWVRGQISKKINSVDIRNVRENLVNDFCTNTEDWISNEPGKARARYDEIMSISCGLGKNAAAVGGLEISISDYFDHALVGAPEGQEQAVVDNKVRFIYNQLIGKSKPSLNLKPNTLEDINRTIMLPSALKIGSVGTMIYNAFRSVMGGTDEKIVYSSVVDEIVCYQTSVANALSDLADVEKWEAGYLASANDQNIHRENAELPALHMQTRCSQYNELSQRETAVKMNVTLPDEILPALRGTDAAYDIERIYCTGLSWLHYPSLCLTKYGSDFSNDAGNAESKFRSDVFAKQIDEALRIGVIEWDRSGTNYKCWLNVIPDEWRWQELSVEGYQPDENGAYPRGRKLFDYLKAQNRVSSGPHRKQIALVDNFFGTGGFDLSQAVLQYQWTEEMVADTLKTYMMRIMRKSTHLYQDMLDTMWKFYPIELELEKKEEVAFAKAEEIRIRKEAKVAERVKQQEKEAEEQKKSKLFEDFVNWMVMGLVKTDEEKYGWTLQTSKKGDTIELMTFGRLATRRMGDFDKKLNNAGLRMYLVFNKYLELVEEEEVNGDDINDLMKSIEGKLTEAQYEAILVATLPMIEDEKKLYDKMAGRSRDAAESLLDALELDDDEETLNKVEEIINFYESVRKVLSEL